MRKFCLGDEYLIDNRHNEYRAIKCEENEAHLMISLFKLIEPSIRKIIASFVTKIPQLGRKLGVYSFL